MGANQRSDGPEKRKFRRVEASFTVVYSVQSPMEARLEFGGKESEGIANDLSEGGLSLLTERPLPEGAVMIIKFRLQNKSTGFEEEASRKFEVQGEVRHSIYTKEKDFRTGVRFMNLAQADRNFIAKCL